MSEYQYFEFRAIDRPLDKAEIAALRRISSRAEITSHGFVNRYDYGDLKADPVDLMERYFDLFVYVANWGTHTVMVRLWREDVDLTVLRRYMIEPVVTIHERGPVVIIELTANDESGDVDEWEGDEEWMSELIGLRQEMADGDQRALYLGWLSAADYGELEDEETEPPVPRGVDLLTPPQATLAKFLRVADDLVTVASLLSDPLPARSDSKTGFDGWIRGLPGAEKDALLLDAMSGGDPAFGVRLRRRFAQEAKTVGNPLTESRRTVGDLIAATNAVTEVRERIEAERRAIVEAKRLAEVAAARASYLDGFARRADGVWAEIEGMAESKKPTEYDRAVRLVADIRDLADRDGDIERFARHLSVLRGRHAKKVSILGRLDEAELEG